MNLLCISNGHGEDVIACRILTALIQQQPNIQLAALPISGVGSAYRSAGIEIVGPTQVLPSGGFLNQDPRQLARDMKGGLLGLTRSQLSAVKKWTKTWTSAPAAHTPQILAVGDIVPLLFAYRSGLPYHFVGTAKSEYWLRDERGKLPIAKFSDRLQGWSGSVYFPWERWLMARPRCRSVFVRDALTANHLQTLGVAAQYAGNPMMDGLAPTGKLATLLQALRTQLQPAAPVPSPSTSGSDNYVTYPTADGDAASVSVTSGGPDKAKAAALFLSPKPRLNPLTIALIPGSRPPEAYENWVNILSAVPGLAAAFPNRSLILLGAIAPSLSLERLEADALAAGLIAARQQQPYPICTYQNVTLVLTNDAYTDCLAEAEVAIATAGTATEQFVGLGKPAITLPGKGPQFTSAFATVQAKMLGPSVAMMSSADDVGSAIAKLISDPDRLQLVYQNGKQRMGDPGAGQRIATNLLDTIEIESK